MSYRDGRTYCDHEGCDREKQPGDIGWFTTRQLDYCPDCFRELERLGKVRIEHRGNGKPIDGKEAE